MDPLALSRKENVTSAAMVHDSGLFGLRIIEAKYQTGNGQKRNTSFEIWENEARGKVGPKNIQETQIPQKNFL